VATSDFFMAKIVIKSGFCWQPPAINGNILFRFTMC